MFTDRQIRNLKPEAKIKDIRGGHGFGIRVKPDGSKTFFYGYQSPVTGARRFVTLGQYPELSLEHARIKHADLYKVVKAGGDPLEAKQQQLEEQSKSPTVGQLCKEYLTKHAMRFKKSWKEDERIINREVIPAWGNRKAGDVVKRDVLRLLESIIDRGSPGMANNSFQVIRKMFNFAVDRDMLPFSPCNGVKLPAPKRLRERALSEEEIAIFWNSLPSCAISAEVRLALKLILVTAQRPGEVIGMHTNEITGEWWTIPGERSKNGKPHRVPLTPLAKELIGEATALAEAGREFPGVDEYEGYVFPTPHSKKESSMARRAMSQAISRNLSWPATDAEGNRIMDSKGKAVTENRLGVAAFTPHDLRRTAATRMAEAGEMDEVIDAVLNHAKQGVIRVYNQFKYDSQKRAALEAWASKLEAIVAVRAGGVRGHLAEG